jgi:ParB-like chromosome segregation protein Spo0J
MKTYGWTTPLLIDEHDVVLAGYGRWEAARELGISQVPVIVAKNWSDSEKRAYMLADNQIALRAGWDEDILKLELDELRLMNFDISLLGFDPIDIRNLDSFGHLERTAGNLADAYLLAPFSILDTRSAWWQERRRGWLALGIKSELGRGDNALRFSQTILQPDEKKRAAQKYGEPL